MAIATTEQFWTSRINGENPLSPSNTNHNEAWSVSGSGSAEGHYWKITSSAYYSVTPSTSDDLTILVTMFYPNASDIPADGTTLLRLRSDSHKVEVQSNGTATGLKIVGTTTKTFTDLDLTKAEIEPYITTIRLTLDATGNAKMYVHEIMEDDFGTQRSLEVTGTSDTTGRTITWGSNDGETKWGSVYATHHGAFSPDELSMSAFYQSTLNRLGLAIRDTLRNSKRAYIKEIPDSSILYGYDLSSGMIMRLSPPTIHIIVQGTASDGFETLGGTSIQTENDAQIMVTTKGTDYQESYRLGLRILGDVFDELYTTTGLNGSKDSLTGYQVQLDTKVDNDEMVCIHMLNVTYMRRERMTIR
tara:strand:+ start:5188 stop:6264 length:1077 start_codon:yes stop_codon:yes gene_type:complete